MSEVKIPEDLERDCQVLTLLMRNAKERIVALEAENADLISALGNFQMYTVSTL